ncbi:MAG: hypothetical protein ACK4KT_02815 [Thermaurantimonas sp.]
MKTPSLITLAGLIFLFIGCKPEISLEKGDSLIVYVENYSIQDFEPYTDCSMALDESSDVHKEIVRLVGKMRNDAFEDEDGSHYYIITIQDANGNEKASVTIPQGGGGHPLSKKLFSNLDRVCGDGN